MTAALTRVRDRSGTATAPVVVAVVALAGVVGGLVLRSSGDLSFVTDPLGLCTSAAAAIVCFLVRRRLLSLGDPRAARFVAAAGLASMVQLWAGVLAVAVWPTRSGVGAVVVAVWNVAWVPPLLLSQLTASAGARHVGARPLTHLLVTAPVVAAMVSGLLLTRPERPFEGVTTMVPDAWSTTLAPLPGITTALAMTALLVLPGLLWRAALTSTGAARARLGLSAAGASAAPVTVAFCLVLAIARDPGAVDPALGSVAFTVAVAAAVGLAAACTAAAARGAVPRGQVRVGVRAVALAVAGLVVLAVGTLLAAPASGLGATAVAVTTAGVAVLVSGLAWVGGGRLARSLEPGVPLAAGPSAPPRTAPPVTVAPPAVPTPLAPPAVPAPPPVPIVAGGDLPELTPRENEVLALLAEGASNAGIATALVVSERTVDAHLRSVFTKLGLESDGGVNRRVRAARFRLGADRRPPGGVAAPGR